MTARDVVIFQAIRDLLDCLTDEERHELLGVYCRGCGCKQPWHPKEPRAYVRGCQCENDE